MNGLTSWTLWEIEYRRGGLVKRPVTEELQTRGSATDTKQAVAKKKWGRNPNDIPKAARRFADYQRGRAGACEVRFDD